MKIIKDFKGQLWLFDRYWKFTIKLQSLKQPK
jgi:hypothetical protein